MGPFVSIALLAVALAVPFLVLLAGNRPTVEKDAGHRRLAQDPKTVILKNLTTPSLETIALWPMPLAEGSTQNRPAVYPFKENPIEFIHITKTGGTAIEIMAQQQAGIKWGRCHYWTGYGCDYQPDRVIPSENFTIDGLPLQGVWWHFPPHWYDPNWMEPYDTFAIVRNPYDRWISEYYCDYFGYKTATTNNTNDPDIMNRWIATNITMATVQYDHTLPQHYYVYDSNGTKVVTHVLKYERLVEDFPKLMRKYGLGERLKLPPKQPHAVGRLTKRNLTRKTIRLINLQAQQDFVKFGYKVVVDPKDFDAEEIM